MEPVALVIVTNGEFMLKTPFHYCCFFSMLIGFYLVPCLYSICFSRVFILRHHRPLMVLDLLLSNAAVFFTFYWLNGFSGWPHFASTLVVSFIGSSFAVWAIFVGSYLTWVKGNAKLETHLTPFTLLFMTFWSCTQSEYLPFSDFIEILRRGIHNIF